MDQQTRQKVMIGVLAVVVLGAGSYFVFTRDSAPKKVEQGPVAETRVRERAWPAAEKQRTRERPTAVVREERTAPRERRERTEVRSTARQRDRGGRKIKKKEEVKPAM